VNVSDRQPEMSYAKMFFGNLVFGVVLEAVFLFHILVLVPPHQVCLQARKAAVPQAVGVVKSLFSRASNLHGSSLNVGSSRCLICVWVSIH